ncbi:MAG: nucleotidyltransferase domain-containing protein [Opitutales bacterium]|nr:nucleotidyltransferase domain-containing protein [Opitutales bacterium]
MTTGTRETVLQQTEEAIREAAARYLPHARLVLFGSRATGRASRRSDFDLAVIPGPHFSSQELIRFREALEESPAIIHPIDILDIRDASPELQQKIKEEGIVWKS